MTLSTSTSRCKEAGKLQKPLLLKVLLLSSSLPSRVLIDGGLPFWEEGDVDEAVRVVRVTEQRGVVGAACVYYELACCLCNNGR